MIKDAISPKLLKVWTALKNSRVGAIPRRSGRIMDYMAGELLRDTSKPGALSRFSKLRSAPGSKGPSKILTAIKENIPETALLTAAPIALGTRIHSLVSEPNTAKFSYGRAANWAGAGLLGGASLASLLSLLHSYKDSKLEEATDEETDKNTIVLTLPEKKASDDFDNLPEYPLMGLNKSAASWRTNTALILSALGGGAVGFKAVDSIYRKLVMDELKRKEEAAKQEYLNLLVNPQDVVTKKADAIITPAMTMWALLSLGGAGLTAGIIKKVLDERFIAEQDKVKPPSITRVVFKRKPSTVPNVEESVPVEETEKSASDSAIDEAFRAMIRINMDIISGKDTLSKDAAVVEELKKEGLDLEQVKSFFTKTVPTKAYDLMIKNPWLRRKILLSGVNKDSLTGGLLARTVDMPGLSKLWDMYGRYQAGNMFGKAAQAEEVREVITSFMGSSLADPAKKNMELDRHRIPSKQEAARAAELINILGADDESKEFIAANKAKIVAALQRAIAKGAL